MARKKTRQLPGERLDNEIARAKNAFKDHVITQRGQGRWVLRRRNESAYWVDIHTFYGGGLCVWGDIDLVMFAWCGSKAPVRIVGWMGGTDSMGYVHEKARIGTGRSADDEWNPDVAVDDIRELLREYVLSDAEYKSDHPLSYVFEEPEQQYDENDDPVPLPPESDDAFWVRMFQTHTKLTEADLARGMEITKKEPQHFMMYWECRDAIDKLIEDKLDRYEHDDIDCFLNAIEAAERHEPEAVVRKELYEHSDVYNATWEAGVGEQMPPKVIFAHAAVQRLHDLLYAERIEHYYNGQRICMQCNSAVQHHAVPNVWRCPVCHWEGAEDKTIPPDKKCL